MIVSDDGLNGRLRQSLLFPLAGRRAVIQLVRGCVS
jgi:hypothetical protein